MRRRIRQRGATTLEYIVLSAVLVLGLIAVINFAQPFGSSGDSKVDRTLLLAFVGAVFAALGWAVRSGVNSLRGRARLLLVDTLSQNPNSTLNDLVGLVGLAHFQLRFFKGTILDALAELVDKGQVVVIDGRYRLSVSKN